MNPLLALQDYGQSIWLDYMQRHLITSGELQRLIEEDGLRGMTSTISKAPLSALSSTPRPTKLPSICE